MISRNQLISDFMNLVYELEPDYLERYTEQSYQYHKYELAHKKLLDVFSQLNLKDKKLAIKFWNGAIYSQFNLAISERYKWEEEKEKPNGF